MKINKKPSINQQELQVMKDITEAQLTGFP